jgi:hypothetical protein
MDIRVVPLFLYMHDVMDKKKCIHERFEFFFYTKEGSRRTPKRHHYRPCRCTITKRKLHIGPVKVRRRPQIWRRNAIRSSRSSPRTPTRPPSSGHHHTTGDEPLGARKREKAGTGKGKPRE